MKLDGLTLLPQQPGMKDAENYDLASTHRTQMLLDMLVLNKPEEILCHSFSRALAQGHMVGICLVAIIVFFQLLVVLWRGLYHRFV